FAGASYTVAGSVRTLRGPHQSRGAAARGQRLRPHRDGRGAARAPDRLPAPAQAERDGARLASPGVAGPIFDVERDGDAHRRSDPWLDGRLLPQGAQDTVARFGVTFELGGVDGATGQDADAQ